MCLQFKKVMPPQIYMHLASCNGYKEAIITQECIIYKAHYHIGMYLHDLK